MKNTLKFTFALFLTLTIISCSNDEINREEMHLYKSEKINFTQLLNNKMGIESKTSKDSEDFIHSEFETPFIIPENLSDTELNNYISVNQNSINGTLKYFINDNDFISVEIVNGVQSKITTNNSYQSKAMDPYPKKDECSYDGIQDCVQYAVYEQWSTYTAIKCAFTGGLGCIADEAASCIESNCF